MNKIINTLKKSVIAGILVAGVALSLTPAQAHAAAADYQKAQVSFTFDDGFESFYTNGYPALKAAGYVGTLYYITGIGDGTYQNGTTDDDKAGMTWAQVQDLQANGWEIGNHTVDHGLLSTYTAAQVDADIVNANTALLAHGIAATDLAFPEGDYLNPTLVETAKYVQSYRGFQDVGLMSYPYNNGVLVDESLDDNMTLAQAEALVDQAVANKQWLIFTGHGVEAKKNKNYAYTWTTANLTALANYVKSKNVPVVTVAQAVKPVGVNLTTNKSFENGLTGWSTDNATAVTVDNNNNGSYGTPTNAVKLTGSATVAHLFSDMINVVPGKDYLVNAFYNATGLTAGEFGFYVDEYDANGTWLSGQFLGSVVNGSVGFFNKIIQTTSTLVSQFRLQAYLNPNSTGTVYTDNVNLYDMAASASATPTITPTPTASASGTPTPTPTVSVTPTATPVTVSQTNTVALQGDSTFHQLDGMSVTNTFTGTNIHIDFNSIITNNTPNTTVYMYTTVDGANQNLMTFVTNEKGSTQTLSTSSDVTVAAGMHTVAVSYWTNSTAVSVGNRSLTVTDGIGAIPTPTPSVSVTPTGTPAPSTTPTQTNTVSLQGDSTFHQLDGMGITNTFTGTSITIDFNSIVTNNTPNTTVYMYTTIDGVNQDLITFVTNEKGSTQTLSSSTTKNVSAGVHTVAVSYWTNSSSVTVGTRSLNVSDGTTTVTPTPTPTVSVTPTVTPTPTATPVGTPVSLQGDATWHDLDGTSVTKTFTGTSTTIDFTSAVTNNTPNTTVYMYTTVDGAYKDLMTFVTNEKGSTQTMSSNATVTIGAGQHTVSVSYWTNSNTVSVGSKNLTVTGSTDVTPTPTVAPTGTVTPTPSVTVTPTPTVAPTGTPAANLVQNGSFETVDSGFPTNWTHDASDGVTVDTTSKGNDGVNSLSMPANTAIAHAYSSMIAIDATKTYTWSQYVNVLTGTGEFGFYIDEYDAAGTWLSGQWKGMLSAAFSGAQTFSYTPTSANVKQIRLQYYKTANTTLPIYIDSVNLSAN